MKKIFLLFVVVLSCFGALDDAAKRVYQGIAGSDERGDYTQNILDPFIATTSLVLDAAPYKSEYFVGEVFAINLTAKTDESTEFEFEVEFNKNDSLVFLNPNLKWQRAGNEYFATLYFEAKDANAELLQIIISLTRNKEAFQDARLNINPIIFKNVAADKKFANLVAQDLQVRHFRSEQFDDKNLVMIVELAAQGANLADFSLQNDKIIEQRVDNIRGDFNATSAFYSAVFAPSVDKIEFSYFNTTTQKFENFSLKVDVRDEKISTQTDLNPKNNSFDMYKRVGLWALALIFIAAFIYKRHFAFIVVAGICVILSLFVGKSSTTQTGILRANSKAQLLPTTQSTYFYTSEKDEEVEILGSRKDYIKVLLQNGQIGWVKKGDITED